MRHEVNLLVITKDEQMKIKKSNLSAEQLVQLVNFLVDRLSLVSNIPHNEILDDLKYKTIGEI